MKEKSRWDKDTMVLISKETRAKLKMKALSEGLTLKEYLEKMADERK